MAEDGLEQQELQRLVAWMDDELDEAEAREVARRVESDPAWRQAHEDFTAVDRLLAMAETPAPPAGLADRIIRTARHRRRSRRIAMVTGALAAAAGIVLAVCLGFSGPQADADPINASSVEQLVAKHLHDVPEADRFMVENLGVFQNYDQVVTHEEVRSIVDDETLAALAELEDSRES